MKIKVILQLVVVLILGFFIGFLTHSSIMSNKIKNYSWRRGEVSFWTRSFSEAEVSEEQQKKIMPIVIKYSEKGHEIMRKSMAEVEPIWEEMEKEIAPLLTKEQLEKIEQLKKKRIEKFRDRTRGSKNKDDKSKKEEDDNSNNNDDKKDE
jgi:hypothetical protein